MICSDQERTANCGWCVMHIICTYHLHDCWLGICTLEVESVVWCFFVGFLFKKINIAFHLFDEEFPLGARQRIGPQPPWLVIKGDL